MIEEGTLKPVGKVQLTNSTGKYTFSGGSLINYKLNTRGGSSGSPLWVVRGNNICLIGIHKSGSGMHNQGIAYDKNRIAFIESILK